MNCGAISYISNISSYSYILRIHKDHQVLTKMLDCSLISTVVQLVYDESS